MYKVYKLWTRRLTMLIAWKENVNNVDIMIIVLDIDWKKGEKKKSQNEHK